MNETHLTARRLTVDAYTALSSSSVHLCLLGREILKAAIELNPEAVIETEKEIGQQEEAWVDTAQYPAEMPLYEQICKRIKEGDDRP